MGELNRVLDLVFGSVPHDLPLIGRTIVHVRYDGCMATKRVEVRTGRILKYESRRLYGSRTTMPPDQGVIVRYPDGDEWEPLAVIRSVGGVLEASY